MSCCNVLLKTEEKLFVEFSLSQILGSVNRFSVIFPENVKLNYYH